MGPRIIDERRPASSRAPLAETSSLSFLSADLAEFVLELGERLIEVSNEPVVGNLENRRFLVLVDGDDDLGVLHPGEVLDRAGNSDCDIELRRDDLARLADLPVVR